MSQRIRGFLNIDIRNASVDILLDDSAFPSSFQFSPGGGGGGGGGGGSSPPMPPFSPHRSGFGSGHPPPPSSFNASTPFPSPQSTYNPTTFTTPSPGHGQTTSSSYYGNGTPGSNNVFSDPTPTNPTITTGPSGQIISRPTSRRTYPGCPGLPLAGPGADTTGMQNSGLGQRPSYEYTGDYPNYGPPSRSSTPVRPMPPLDSTTPGGSQPGSRKGSTCASRPVSGTPPRSGGVSSGSPGTAPINDATYSVQRTPPPPPSGVNPNASGTYGTGTGGSSGNSYGSGTGPSSSYPSPSANATMSSDGSPVQSAPSPARPMPPLDSSGTGSGSGSRKGSGCFLPKGAEAVAPGRPAPNTQPSSAVAPASSRPGPGSGGKSACGCNDCGCEPKQQRRTSFLVNDATYTVQTSPAQGCNTSGGGCSTGYPSTLQSYGQNNSSMPPLQPSYNYTGDDSNYGQPNYMSTPIRPMPMPPFDSTYMSPGQLQGSMVSPGNRSGAGNTFYTSDTSGSSGATQYMTIRARGPEAEAVARIRQILDSITGDFEAQGIEIRPYHGTTTESSYNTSGPAGRHPGQSYGDTSSSAGYATSNYTGTPGGKGNYLI